MGLSAVSMAMLEGFHAGLWRDEFVSIKSLGMRHRSKLKLCGFSLKNVFSKGFICPDDTFITLWPLNIKVVDLPGRSLGRKKYFLLGL